MSMMIYLISNSITGHSLSRWYTRWRWALIDSSPIFNFDDRLLSAFGHFASSRMSNIPLDFEAGSRALRHSRLGLIYCSSIIISWHTASRRRISPRWFSTSRLATGHFALSPPIKLYHDTRIITMIESRRRRYALSAYLYRISLRSAKQCDIA